MPLFPINRTPLGPQRELRTFIVTAALVAALSLVTIAIWTGNKEDADPVGKEYYVKAQKDESWIEKLAGDPVALFTMVLTAATVGLWLATRSLWVATERLVEGAEDTSQRQLRAYVFIESAALIESETAFPKVQLNFRNCGSTPANSVRLQARFASVYKPIDAHPPDADPSDYTGSQGILGPGMYNHVDVSIMNSVNVVDRMLVTTGVACLIVYGIIDYIDVFGSKRITRFCYFKEGLIRDGYMTVYHLWNEAT